MMGLFVVALCVGLQVITAQNSNEASVPCYDELNRPQRCQPPFVNAAYGKVVDATNTCGVTSQTEYCLQTGVTGARKYCYSCYDRDPERQHPPSYLTDFNNNFNWTWWQSETMLEGIQYPTVVNLTLHLKKSFDITYVNLRFYSPRPESFAIFKRSSEDGEWIPYQYYSGSCSRTYGLPRRGIITAANEDQAICTSEFSDISPLTGGSVAFSTLEGRPSMFEFNQSPKLQDWVTATDIKIVLTRMNTFGDEVFGDPQVLRSYFYAISDLAVGARCKCNGHARECKPVRGQDLTDRLECVCEHFTTGQDCQQCLPFYNNKPWGRATEENANECQACDCNGMTDKCEFDAELYRLTGQGGRCLECRDSTAGVHCELCEVNHYRREGRCLDCMCNEVGSQHMQCDETGQCPCKPGVGGQRCDRCEAEYFDFGESGCRACACLEAGSLDNAPRCNPETGLCQCKENVDGRQCDKCKPGFFGLNTDDPYGCISCFCYGHSSECSYASGFHPANITSNFDTGRQRWTAIDRSNREVETQYNGVVENLGVSSDTTAPNYFLAPSRYHGDQRFSYNQFLTFDLRIGEETSRPSVVDIIIEGSGKSISTHIFAQGNPVPNVAVQTFEFRIHEHQEYQWSPKLNPVDFIGILANITAIKIRGTYSNEGVGFIDNIVLGTARQGYVPGEEALWVEQCTCRNGHIGQFCESCTSGYKRDIPYGGPFSRCVPCQCNNHSTSCDVASGRCICEDNTEGDFCERCARGYYGDATMGNSDDCTACPCPNGGACIQLPNADVVCTECEDGYGGNLCDVCLDGYYGDPSGKLTGVQSPCKKCTCSGKIDPNAVGNCNTTTGECLKCVKNTGGFFCEQCLPDFYNNTLGQCTACNCYPPGTVSQPGMRGCDVNSGQCLCQDNVIGRQCERCELGYWDILSGAGCKPCECDVIGSTNYTCDERTGQCACKTGVSGQMCEKCADYHFGHSITGCTACNCDPVGSLDLQCDLDNGHCECKENVDGPRCDRCMENKYDLKAGCLDCPQCYNLVQKHVNNHRGKLRQLTVVIDQTVANPSLFNDTTFVSHLNQVSMSIDELLRDARGASTGDGTIGHQLDALRESLHDVMDKCGVISKNIASASRATADSQSDVQAAQEAINRAETALGVARNYIDEEGRAALKQALEALDNFGHRSEQMTKIAQDAAAAAKRQKEEAQLIEDLANKALDTSKEALRMANESLGMPMKTDQEIKRLRREYDDANQLFQSTKTVANNTLNRAQSARDAAYTLLSLAQEELPEIDVARLKSESDNIKDQAEDLKKRAQQLMDDNKDLMMKVQNQTSDAKDLLNEGDSLNQDLGNLLAEVDFARSEARKAVEQAEQTLKEANDTLTTLNQFEQLTDNKDAANEAMKKVPAIQKTIQDAIDVTQEARDALAGVENDANQALLLAKQAEEKARMASKEADSIRQNAEMTKNDADSLKNDAEDLSTDVGLVKEAVDAYDQEVGDDESMANEALKQAAMAKQNAKTAHEEVTKVYELINGIKDQLNDIDSIDQTALDALDVLEEKLDMVEKQLNETEIDKKIKDLMEKSDGIEQKANLFFLDLEQLRIDVDNIEDISKSLPNECFKNVPIEGGTD